VAPPGFTPTDVVSFQRRDSSLPRSVALCVEQLESHLGQLRSRYGLRGTVAALERVEELRAGLLGRPVEKIISDGLHLFLDGVQRDLILLAAEIGTAFFRDWRPLAEPAEPPPAMSVPSQSQTQSQGQVQAIP
jgi:uncharacterized alpha-E superfamily protein